MTSALCLACFLDLSRSIRDLSLGNSSPANTGADLRSHRLVYRDPGGKQEKVAEGHPPTRCPHVHSSPSLGIERSSLFHRNAAEKLDTFFSEKLKAWASDSARLSDTEGAQEEPPSSGPAWRASQNGPATHQQRVGGQKPRRAVHGNLPTEQADSFGDNYGPRCKRWQRCPEHRAAGKGQASDGLSHPQEGSRLSTSASSSARILPQCRISHIQRCRACQAFNQDKPAGKGGVWAPLQEEEGGTSTSLSPQKDRTQPHGQPQVPDRIAKVQRWLEQTPLDSQPAPHRSQEKHRTANRARPGTQGQRPLYGCAAQRQGETRTPEVAGDHQNRGVPAEARRPRKSRHGEHPKHPPAAHLLPFDDASTSPATCSCLFCERQRPHGQLVSGKEGPDLSAEQVAARLQAENRVPRIVEAFERRSLREAKIAEREKALQAALQQDPERKRRVPASHGEPKRGAPASGPPKAPASQEKKKAEEPPRRRKEGETVRKQPSFLDRLRRRS
ncbi:uncharacterized protein [Erythrolamprus reginae]|uniref:uncharacterized protein isoform X2 n=1 Tax=Erythrolamprus reginae TaxID=121349 RepID=UPI00396C4A10